MNRRKVLGFAVGPVGTALLSLLSVPLIAWYFAPEDIGRLSMLQTAISFCVLSASLGLDQAYVREYHEADSHPALLKTCLWPGLLLLGALTIPLMLLSKQISSWLFDSPNSAYVWITYGCAFMAFLARFLSLILRMQERALAFSMSQLLPKFIFLSVIGLIVVTQVEAQFVYLALALTWSTVCVVGLYALNTRADWRAAVIATFDAPLFHQLMSYSVPLVFAGLAYWGLASTSVITLRVMSSLSELGTYSVSLSFAGIAVIVQSLFSVVWAPIVYRWIADGGDLARVDQIAGQMLAVICVAFSLTGTFSWLIGPLLPPQYFVVESLVLCTIAPALLYTLSEVTGIGVNIARRTSLFFWSILGAFFVNVVLSVLLIPRFGASGAVVSTAIAYLVLLVARTESSGHAWRQFPRTKLYLCTFSATGLAILTVILGPANGSLFNAIWLATLPLVAWGFRREGHAVYLAALGSTVRP